MKKKQSAEERRKQLGAVVRDRDIDTSDIPEITNFSGAERGKFYRAVKQQLTLRLDSDLVAWFKDQASEEQGYQTKINDALREYVAGHDRKRA